ncbi:phosphatase PAP2 family protein [Legionella sp. CNM-4043-24]|uniref:phosphatase PAP2 family protein n=1 Tax=Legionella sp. CNM-4043-24 TaxID=3421646 RepID=UPI00403B2017
MRQAAEFFLFFDNLYLLVPLMLLGMVAINRSLFYEATYLTLFSILINVALKVTFKVPLTLIVGHPGYGLPSGHMQLAMVFYGFLACHALGGTGAARYGFSLIILMLLTGIGWALTYKGYHSVDDVLAAVATGLILLAIHRPLRRYIPLMATCAFIYSSIRYTHLPRHALIAFILLWCFVLYERFKTQNLRVAIRAPSGHGDRTAHSKEDGN